MNRATIEVRRGREHPVRGRDLEDVVVQVRDAPARARPDRGRAGSKASRGPARARRRESPPPSAPPAWTIAMRSRLVGPKGPRSTRSAPGSRAAGERRRRGGPAPGSGAAARPPTRAYASSAARIPTYAPRVNVRSMAANGSTSANSPAARRGRRSSRAKPEQQAAGEHGQPRERHVVGEVRADAVLEVVAAVRELPDPDERQHAALDAEGRERPPRPRCRVGEVHGHRHEKEEREAGEVARADGRIAGEDGGQDDEGRQDAEAKDEGGAEGVGDAGVRPGPPPSRRTGAGPRRCRRGRSGR